MSKLTREQMENAVRYGLCERCGSPRECRRADNAFGLVCPMCPDMYDGPEVLAHAHAVALRRLVRAAWAVSQYEPFNVKRSTWEKLLRAVEVYLQAVAR